VTSKPRTIADSTADISRRYAEDMTALDLGLITEADISKGIQLPKYQPVPAELDQLLGLEKKNQPWASFTPPPNFTMVAIFHVFLVPFMGTSDDQKDLKKKLTSRKFKDKKEKKEQDTFATLVDECIDLQKAIEFIHGRRGQFGKG